MRIDSATRTATLSVGEFASFRPYAQPGYGGIAAAWRAQLGTEWHQRIQADSAAAGEAMRDELPIKGDLPWRGWTLRLSGRIDQIKSTPDSVQLREIKTVSEPLPLARPALLERYLSYPIQLLAYRELLLRAAPDFPASPAAYLLELLFVEIGTGLSQSIRLDPSYDTLLVDQLDTLVDYLEAQQERLDRLRSLAVRPAYPSPRPGQETIQAELDASFATSPVVLLEAPTGYGKTGVAWEYAARRLASGQSDRILYLTSKTTGQTEALARLRSLLAPPPPSEISNLESQIPALLPPTSGSPPLPPSALRPPPSGSPTPPPSVLRPPPSGSPTATFWHIRNKQEHCIHTEFRCSAVTCPYLANLNAKWKRAGLQRLYLLAHDELSLDTIKAEGRATGICPYEIMRAGLGYRDVWVGDYNYIFSHSSTRLLADQADFEPSRTFLVIDEAHNLPSRVAAAYTHALSLHSLYAAIDDLRETRSSSRLQNNLKSLAILVNELPAPPSRSSNNAAAPSRQAASPHLEAEFHDHLATLVQQLSGEPLPYEDLQPETLELLFTLAAAHSARQRGELDFLLWAPAPGEARLECIDASRLVAAELARYGGVLALSATLSPVDSFLAEIGLAKQPIPHLRPPAPWRANAYDVAIDLRVDTRLRSRASHLAATAATIAAMAERAAPAIVFFPSYAYAEAALAALQHHHPVHRAILQPRAGGSLAERLEFLEHALAFHDALFLILGSSYAEGVDSLGGKARSAIVVSPALPEMNIVQEAKRQRHDALGQNGFERAYLQPGIQKVNQALGRLVRAPGHHAKVLLHCQRFAEPKTRALLDPLYQTKTYLHSTPDLATWLAAPSPHLSP